MSLQKKKLYLDRRLCEWKICDKKIVLRVVIVRRILNITNRYENH